MGCWPALVDWAWPWRSFEPRVVGRRLELGGRVRAQPRRQRRRQPRQVVERRAVQPRASVHDPRVTDFARSSASGPDWAYRPCVVRALARLAKPSGVRGPVLLPPCIRQRPFGIAGARQARPVVRAFAPQRGARLGLPRGLPLRSGSLRGAGLGAGRSGEVVGLGVAGGWVGLASGHWSAGVARTACGTVAGVVVVDRCICNTGRWRLVIPSYAEMPAGASQTVPDRAQPARSPNCFGRAGCRRCARSRGRRCSLRGRKRLAIAAGRRRGGRGEPCGIGRRLDLTVRNEWELDVPGSSMCRELQADRVKTQLRVWLAQYRCASEPCGESLLRPACRTRIKVAAR
jgi:hypothetical protein